MRRTIRNKITRIRRTSRRSLTVLKQKNALSDNGGRGRRKALLRCFQALSQKCEKRLLASSCPSVHLSVCMEQLGSHWTGFHEILYLSFFRKSVGKFWVSLKSDRNNGYFAWRLFTFMTIHRWILSRMRNVWNVGRKESQNSRFIFSNFLWKCAVYRIM